MSDGQLTSQYQQIMEQIPNTVQLVAVSKNHAAEKIKTIYDLGQRVFGENRVQELVEKHEILPPDIQWHLIGHLQTNKVKYIAPFINTIQSVDSRKILKEINKEAKKNERVINVLLQVKIAAEDSKFGLTEIEAEDLFSEYMEGKFPNIKIGGLMGMATYTEDIDQINIEFSKLKNLYNHLKDDGKLSSLSMGMSGDFQQAIECGSNSVRIGSAIFGDRN